jgi:hypothetical protein
VIGDGDHVEAARLPVRGRLHEVTGV